MKYESKKNNEKSYSIYKYLQNVSLQLFGLLILIMLAIEFTNFQIGYYINITNISLLASLMLAFSSYKTLNERRTKIIVKTLFFFSAIVLIFSNLFFIETLEKYHNILYAILIGQIILFPFIIKDIYSKERKRKKIDNKSFKSKILIAILLILILILSFFLRAYNADVISPGRDSLHHYIAAKSIIDNGATVYDTLPYINYMLVFIFKYISESLFFARLPFIIAGTLSVLLLYFIGRKISEEVGIVSAILFAVTPWAIGLSRYVRDYAFNIFFELFFIVMILYFPKSIKNPKSFGRFILMNIVIYSGLIIFARFQGGLTISMIIALLIATIIRIFTELNLYKKVKSLSIQSKELNLVMSSLILLLCVGILVIVLFGFDNRLTLTFQPKWFFFFLSESPVPMLWYSFMYVPWFFIFVLTLIPIIGKPKNRYVWISFLIFYSYLIFFVFLARPHTSLLYARYVYTALPFFIILIAISLIYIITMSRLFFENNLAKKISFFVVLIFLLSVFNFNNTLVASDGRLDMDKDGRQVISVPHRDYSELMIFLDENGFTNEDIVIASELRMKDVLSWYYDFDFYQGRNITSFNGLDYDIADNIYVLEESSVDVIKNNEKGWIIRRDGDRFPRSISERSRDRVLATNELDLYGVQIEYLGKYSEKYEVYRWYRNG